MKTGVGYSYLREQRNHLERRGGTERERKRTFWVLLLDQMSCLLMWWHVEYYPVLFFNTFPSVLQLSMQTCVIPHKGSCVWFHFPNSYAAYVHIEMWRCQVDTDVYAPCAIRTCVLVPFHSSEVMITDFEKEVGRCRKGTVWEDNYLWHGSVRFNRYQAWLNTVEWVTVFEIPCLGSLVSLPPLAPGKIYKVVAKSVLVPGGFLVARLA